MEKENAELQSCSSSYKPRHVLPLFFLSQVCFLFTQLTYLLSCFVELIMHAFDYKAMDIFVYIYIYSHTRKGKEEKPVVVSVSVIVIQRKKHALL